MYGKIIKQLRKNAGLKQADLAELLGVSRPNISFWENADYPPLEAIDKICKVLGIELWKFFSEDPSGNQVQDITSKHADLIDEISRLSREEYDDLLKIISIYLRKNKTASAGYPAITEPGIDSDGYTGIKNLRLDPSLYYRISVESSDHPLPFIERNVVYKALINYTERFLRMM